MNTSSQPLVSVVTAFYNEEKFLEETILSVINQTYGNWELLLVDDGSPDGSTAIAKSYAERYPDRIFYLQHENHANKGVCHSRNLGIAHAKGEFVAYLDADDVWLKDKLKNQLEIFQNNPEATVLLEASNYWYTWENTERKDVVVELGTGQDKLYYPPQLVIDLYPLGEGAAPCPSGIMVRRKIHEHILFVPDFIGPTAVYEDQAFLAQIYLKENVYVSSQANNLYRQRIASQVYNVHQDGRYLKVRHFYLNWFTEYLKKNNIQNTTIDNLLKKAFLPYDHPFLYRTKSLTGRMVEKVKSKLSKIIKSPQKEGQ